MATISSGTRSSWGILETDLSTLTRDVETLLERGEAEQAGGVAP